MLMIATKSSQVYKDVFSNNTQWINNINYTIGTDKFLRKYDDYYLQRFQKLEQKLSHLSEIEARLNALYRLSINLNLFYFSELIDQLRKKGIVKFTYHKTKALIKKIINFLIKIKLSRKNKLNLIKSENKLSKNRFFSRYKFYPRSHDIYSTIKRKIRNKN